MGRMKDAIVETAAPDAMNEVRDLAAAVRDCFISGDDIECAVVAQLVKSGVPAAMLVDGTRERGLAVQIARSLNTALLSFGALRCAAATFTQESAAPAVTPCSAC